LPELELAIVFLTGTQIWFQQLEQSPEAQDSAEEKRTSTAHTFVKNKITDNINYGTNSQKMLPTTKEAN